MTREGARACVQTRPSSSLCHSERSKESRLLILCFSVIPPLCHSERSEESRSFFCHSLSVIQSVAKNPGLSSSLFLSSRPQQRIPVFPLLPCVIQSEAKNPGLFSVIPDRSKESRLLILCFSVIPPLCHSERSKESRSFLSFLVSFRAKRRIPVFFLSSRPQRRIPAPKVFPRRRFSRKVRERQ